MAEERQTGSRRHRGAHAAGGGARMGSPWRQWGPYLSERQWGTVREDYSAERRRVGLLPARSRAVARLSLGRGRPRRLLRSEAAAVFRARAVERQGSDSQGAAVRPEQRRGQSRRGREGVLLLSRFDADPLVHEVALQVSRRRRFPYDDLVRTNARRSRHGLRVRADRHRRLRRGPLLRRRRRVCQVVAGGMLRADHRRPTAVRRRRRSICCRRCGSATPGPGGPSAAKPHLAAAKAASGTSVVAASHPELGDRWLYCDGAPPLLFTENETNTERLVRHAERQPLRQGRVPRAAWWTGTTRRRQPGRGRHQGRRALPPRGRRRPVGDASGCA